MNPGDAPDRGLTQPSEQWRSQVPEHLRDGNPAAMSLWVSEIEIAGTRIALPSGGVTAIVGGNNVGKSTVLTEIVNLLARNSGQLTPAPIVVSDLTVSTAGTDADLIAWLGRHAQFVLQTVGVFVRRGVGNPVSPDYLALNWPNHAGDRLGQLLQYLVHYSRALDRAAIVAPVNLRDNVIDPPVSPIHELQDDADLLRDFDMLSRRVFQLPLTLDRISGQLRLRVGKPSIPAPPVDAVTAEYRTAIGALPDLFSQGDGIKSFLGLLLPIVTATYPIIVVDEPEAFLHPPQAFELGRILSSLASSRGVQIILATHDRHLLAGLVHEDAPVSVVRLEREGDITTAWQLDASNVRALWSDPILRYTNVLDGLFHRLVVLAEADPDCKFYAAAIEALSMKRPLPIPHGEIHFVPSNGKAGMAKIATALAAVHVQVVAVADLDVLNDADLLRALVEALGGDWTSLERDYLTATAEFRSQPVQATVGDIRKLLNDILASHDGEPWSPTTLRMIKPHLRTSSSEWQRLKDYGMSAFKAAPGAAERLLNQLGEARICCVRAGELERLAPTLEVAKGSRWLGAALASRAHENAVAQDHAIRILQSAGMLVVEEPA